MGTTTNTGRGCRLDRTTPLVSKHSEAFKNPESGLYTTTVADDNLRAALGLGKDTSDAEMMHQSTNERRWGRNSDKSYRDKVCSGTRRDMRGGVKAQPGKAAAWRISWTMPSNTGERDGAEETGGEDDSVDGAPGVLEGGRDSKRSHGVYEEGVGGAREGGRRGEVGATA